MMWQPLDLALCLQKWIIIQIFKNLVCWEGHLCKQIIVIQWDQGYDGTMSIVSQEFQGDAPRSLYERCVIWAAPRRKSRSSQHREGRSRQWEQHIQQRHEAGGWLRELHVVWRSWSRGCTDLDEALGEARAFISPVLLPMTVRLYVRPVFMGSLAVPWKLWYKNCKSNSCQTFQRPRIIL